MAYRSIFQGGSAAALMILCASTSVSADQTSNSYTLNGLYTSVEKLEQGWSDGAAQWYYHASQGSQIMHYDIFLALEMADSDMMLKDAVVSRYDYLAGVSKIGNPDLLPIGFARDEDGKNSWIGMTCAACHTGRVDYKGHKVMIDGAPSLGDLSGLVAGMIDALKAARTDPAKQARFIERILGQHPSKSAKIKLLKRLDDNIARVNDIVQDSFLTAPRDQKVVWGHGRTDAFGMIFNRVAATDLNYPANRQPPNAPVSYPHLWDTSRFDWVQWNAVVPNNNAIEKLFRNAGEVLGVFGTAKLTKPTPGHDYYRSSLNIGNLLWMEGQIEGMRAPKWTDLFGALDAEKVAHGAVIYDKTCSGCHQLLPAGTDPFKVGLTKVDVVGTDPVMSRNALRSVSTAQLAGVAIPPGSTPLKAPKDLGVALLRNAVLGSVLGRVFDPFQGGVAKVAWNIKNDITAYKWANMGESTVLAHDDAKLRAILGSLANMNKASPTPDLSSYKSRPLDGIWATAPFLHNGSVPNLYQLLLPAAQRDKSFKVGSFNYDPMHVGYVTDEGATTFDATKPGDSNAGHEYGTNLSEQDRWALVEYLKGL